jgi:uncharacterized membrane protein YkvA (DUF1232 family)
MEEEKKTSYDDMKIVTDINEAIESYEANDYPEFDEKEFKEKEKFVDENIWLKLAKTGEKFTLARDVLALYRYMKDPLVPIYKKAVVVLGLIYFIIPFDAMPDIAPIVGYLDDLGVIVTLLKFLGAELTPYYE